jgi:glycosyltransferase involved in cell wall biosynthesis
MVKLFVNRRPHNGPWGGGNNFTRSLFGLSSQFGVEVVTDPSRGFDAILMLDPRYDEMGVSINEIADFKSKNPSCPVFYRVNECDARKGTSEIDDVILRMHPFIDEYIFVSNWMKQYFVSKGIQAKKTSVIYNGVDKTHFFENQHKSASDKLRIVTHHWSNNPLKGFDIYDQLDSSLQDLNVEFTYVGRDRGSFKNTKVIPPLSGKELGDAIRDHDLYLSASRHDPGPNHVIEAVASGLPILAHADGGGAVEFAGEMNVYKTFDDLISLITARKFHRSPVVFDDWSSCIENYVNQIKSKGL